MQADCESVTFPWALTKQWFFRQYRTCLASLTTVAVLEECLPRPEVPVPWTRSPVRLRAPSPAQDGACEVTFLLSPL